MRFMMFIYPGDAAETGAMPDVETVSAMMKYNEELAAAGVLLSLEGLHPSSNGSRIYFNGAEPTVEDGPFAGDLVGGFWMLQVDSKEEAVAWARRCPAGNSGFIELRRIFEMSDFPADVQEAGDSPALRAHLESVQSA